jgi:uncharacterized protein (TIGR03435 family)
VRLGVGLCFLVAGSSALFAQAFEVATVKPDTGWKEGGHGMSRDRVSTDPGRLTMLNVTLRRTICWAYDVKTYQVTGPAWLDESHYDITGKAPEAAQEAEQRVMLQHLLGERFKLEFHREKKELPVYVLVVAKGGPKFKESKSEGEFAAMPTGRTSATFQRATVSLLVDTLTQLLRMPVLDETGLKGHYDVSVDMASYLPENFEHSNGPPPDIAGIVMSALPDQLGLKLESRKAPLDLLVVDHAEKAPIEN